jgi:transcriptional regulator GlxA family with amidase domain
VGLVAEQAGPVKCSSGLRLIADRSFHEVRRTDTLMVAGGIGHAEAVEIPGLLDWLRRMSPKVRRLCSVCTGALILARAGLLDHRNATTHWSYTDALREAGRDIRVRPDDIFVRDGRIFTSAGVTAGMDMALARRSAMSPRNFARRFQAETGLSPAHYVGSCRLDAARRRLETTPLPLTRIAAFCGFGSGETMRRTFVRRLGISPRDYRARFAGRRWSA